MIAVVTKVADKAGMRIRGASMDNRWVYGGELYFVYEGRRNKNVPVPEGMLALSENGTHEGPYFAYSIDHVLLGDDN